MLQTETKPLIKKSLQILTDSNGLSPSPDKSLGRFSVIWSYWNCCPYSISCNIMKQRCFLCQKVPLCCKLPRDLCVPQLTAFLSCPENWNESKLWCIAHMEWQQHKELFWYFADERKRKKWPVVIYVYFLECLFFPIQTSLGVSPGSVMGKGPFSITERHVHSRENTAFIWGINRK